MLLLALDTTTKVCSAALGDGERIWAEYLLNTGNTHSKHLMPLLISLLKDAGVHKSQLQGVAVCGAGIVYRYPHRHGNSKRIMPGVKYSRCGGDDP